MGSKSFLLATCILVIVALMVVELSEAAVTASRTRSKSHSASRSLSLPASHSRTVTRTRTVSPTPTPPSSLSPTPTVTASVTTTPSITPSRSATVTVTRTVTPSRTASVSASSAPYCTDNSVTLQVDGVTVTPTSSLNVYLFVANSDYTGATGGIGIENRTLTTQTTSVELPIFGPATFPAVGQTSPILFFNGTLDTPNYPQVWPSYTGFHSGCVGNSLTTATCSLAGTGVVTCTVNFIGLIDTTPCSHTLLFKACWRTVMVIPSYPQPLVYRFAYSF